MDATQLTIAGTLGEADFETLKGLRSDMVSLPACSDDDKDETLSDPEQQLPETWECILTVMLK